MPKPAEIKKRARRLAQDGKIVDAIRVLEELAAAESVDPYDLVTLGDLCVRGGRQADATQYYVRAVEAYREASLLRNGIALCRKVVRSQISDARFLLLLAELCDLEGLVLDAVSVYLDYADALDPEKEDGDEKWLDALSRLAPKNVDLLSRQAEVLVRWNRASQAVSLLRYGAESTSLDEDRARLLETADQIATLEGAGMEVILPPDPSHPAAETPAETDELVDWMGPAPAADPSAETDLINDLDLALSGGAEAIAAPAPMETPSIEIEPPMLDGNGPFVGQEPGGDVGETVPNEAVVDLDRFLELADGSGSETGALDAAAAALDALASDPSAIDLEGGDDEPVIEIDLPGDGSRFEPGPAPDVVEPAGHVDPYALDPGSSPDAEVASTSSAGEDLPEWADPGQTGAEVPGLETGAMDSVLGGASGVRESESPEAMALQARLRESPFDAEVLEKLLELYEREGDILSSLDLRERLAQALLNRDEPRAALDHYRKILNAEPNHRTVRERCRRLAEELGEELDLPEPSRAASGTDGFGPSSAQVDLDGVALVDVRDDAALVGEDEMLDLGSLLTEFRKGLADGMTDAPARAHYDMGLSHMEMELYDEAAQAFEAACTDSQLEPEARELWGRCLTRAGKPDEAIRVLRAALALRSESLGVRYQLGLALEAAGETDEAIRLYQSIVREDPDFEDSRARMEALGGSDCPTRPPT